MKCTKRQELVVGWKQSDKKGGALASLLLGYYDKGKLIYADKVGTGFGIKQGYELAAKLSKRSRPGSPFVNVPRAEARGALWTEPRTVVKVEFTEWTRDGYVRHRSRASGRTSLRARFDESNHSKSMTLADIQTLHEPYAYLYVGDYFADTLDLSAPEHRALRLLLLETWVRGPVGNVRLARAIGLTRAEWQAVKPAVLPLLRAVQPRIAQSLKNIRAYDGQRLMADDWHIVRSIVLERDGHACVYCGADKHLEGDHIVPLSLGGSNALTNLATACRPCNLSKASSTLAEWHARRAAVVPTKRGNRRRRIR